MRLAVKSLVYAEPIIYAFIINIPLFLLYKPDYWLDDYSLITALVGISYTIYNAIFMEAFVIKSKKINILFLFIVIVTASIILSFFRTDLYIIPLLSFLILYFRRKIHKINFFHYVWFYMSALGFILYDIFYEFEYDIIKTFFVIGILGCMLLFDRKDFTLNSDIFDKNLSLYILIEILFTLIYQFPVILSGEIMYQIKMVLMQNTFFFLGSFVLTQYVVISGLKGLNGIFIILGFLSTITSVIINWYLNSSFEIYFYSILYSLVSTLLFKRLFLLKFSNKTNLLLFIAIIAIVALIFFTSSPSHLNLLFMMLIILLPMEYLNLIFK